MDYGKLNRSFPIFLLATILLNKHLTVVFLLRNCRKISETSWLVYSYNLEEISCAIWALIFLQFLKPFGCNIFCNYSALRLHSYTAVLSALLMYTFCTKWVQNGTVKLIFLTKSMSKILAFYGRLNCYYFLTVPCLTGGNYCNYLLQWYSE